MCRWYHSSWTLYNAGNWQITIFPSPTAKSESIILLKGQLNKIEVFLKLAMYVYLPWWITATIPASAFQPVSLLLALAFDLRFLFETVLKPFQREILSIKVWSKWNWYQTTRYVNYKLYSWLALHTSATLVKDLPNIFSHSFPVESSRNFFFTNSKAFCSFKQHSVWCKFRQRRACFRIVADKPSVEVFIYHSKEYLKLFPGFGNWEQVYFVNIFTSMTDFFSIDCLKTISQFLSVELW